MNGCREIADPLILDLFGGPAWSHISPTTRTENIYKTLYKLWNCFYSCDLKYWKQNDTLNSDPRPRKRQELPENFRLKLKNDELIARGPPSVSLVILSFSRSRITMRRVVSFLQKGSDHPENTEPNGLLIEFMEDTNEQSCELLYVKIIHSFVLHQLTWSVA